MVRFSLVRAVRVWFASVWLVWLVRLNLSVHSVHGGVVLFGLVRVVRVWFALVCVGLGVRGSVGVLLWMRCVWRIPEISLMPLVGHSWNLFVG